MRRNKGGNGGGFCTEQTTPQSQFQKRSRIGVPAAPGDGKLHNRSNRQEHVFRSPLANRDLVAANATGRRQTVQILPVGPSRDVVLITERCSQAKTQPTGGWRQVIVNVTGDVKTHSVIKRVVALVGTKRVFPRTAVGEVWPGIQPYAPGRQATDQNKRLECCVAVVKFGNVAGLSFEVIPAQRVGVHSFAQPVDVLARILSPYRR